MSRSSPSVLFTQYTDLFCDEMLEDLFTDLFGSSCEAQMLLCFTCSSMLSISFSLTNSNPPFNYPSVSSSYNIQPRFISRDWTGIRPPIDATMVGKVYLTPKPTASPPPVRRRNSRKRRPSKRRGSHRRRQSRHVFDDLWLYNDWLSYDYSDVTDETTVQDYRSTPVQNVYFFIRGMFLLNINQAAFQKNISSFFFSDSWPQTSTTEWLCRQSVWTSPALLTHDPLQNTGWAASVRRRLIHPEQRSDKQGLIMHCVKHICL